MAHRDLELLDLTRAWRDTVVLHLVKDDYPRRVRPCWFGVWMPGVDDDCEGPIEGNHWIKRGRVRNALAALGFDTELIRLAEWDARNGVPACEKHHRRFDRQRMPSLIVPRHLVPEHVEQFVAEWGLETQLEDWCKETR